MKTKLLIILILLFASFKAGAQEPIFVKNIYATLITVKENGDIVREAETLYYPTTIIIDAKNKLVTLEYSNDLPLICKLIKITISADGTYADIYAETNINKTVLFKIYDDKAFFIDEEKSIILFTKNNFNTHLL